MRQIHVFRIFSSVKGLFCSRMFMHHDYEVRGEAGLSLSTDRRLP